MRAIVIGVIGLLLASVAWGRDSDKIYGVYWSPRRATLSPTPTLASPKPLTASTNSNRVSLTWNNIQNETGFLIERRRRGDQRFSEIAKTTTNVTTYTDLLTTTEGYDYRVRAYTANGNMIYSPYTNTVSSSVPCP